MKIIELTDSDEAILVKIDTIVEALNLALLEASELGIEINASFLEDKYVTNLAPTIRLEMELVKIIGKVK